MSPARIAVNPISFHELQMSLCARMAESASVAR